MNIVAPGEVGAMPVELPEKETLPHLIRRALIAARDGALVERDADGAWSATSSHQLLERVERVACAIRDAGLERGDRVALIARDCVDWVVCDFATFFAGCVVVPIFPTQALDLTSYILTHADAKLLFVDTQAALERLRAAIPVLPPAIVFEGGDAASLATFEQRGQRVRDEHPELPSAYEADAKPSDLAVLIYTSGTTGQPKGVMLTHDNLGFDAQSSLRYGIEEFVAGDNVLSVLPFSHIYEHTMIYIYLLAGMTFHICHDPNDLLADLREVRPSVMTAVPRIFDRVLAGVRGQAMKSGGLQGRLIPWALRVARLYSSKRVFKAAAPPWIGLQYAFANAIVLKKLRKKLGLDRVRSMLSGSAALHVDVAMTFLGMGVPIMQGYGLTETSPVITTSKASANRYGAVGRPIPGSEIKIADDGEILTRGRNVMQGYYREPDASAVALADGWFHTGDIGTVDDDGYLRITDRKKEVFKTSTGKYVAPARVESAIKRSAFIAQALVVGDGQSFPAALIVPNVDLLRVEFTEPELSPEALVARDDVVQFMTSEVRKRTSDLASYEQVRHIVLLPHEFSVESGELSPSMKVKRRVVEDRYRCEIESMYLVASR